MWICPFKLCNWFYASFTIFSIYTLFKFEYSPLHDMNVFSHKHCSFLSKKNRPVLVAEHPIISTGCRIDYMKTGLERMCREFHGLEESVSAGHRFNSQLQLLCDWIEYLIILHLSLSTQELNKEFLMDTSTSSQSHWIVVARLWG